MLLQRLDARFGDLFALAFKRERLGHNSDRQHTHLARNFGDDRCRTGAGSATHAGGNKEHIGTLNQLRDAFTIFNCRLTTHVRVGTRTQALGDRATQLHGHFCLIAFQRLRVGIGANEFHACHTVADHVVDCIAAAAPHTDHFDDRFRLLCIDNLNHVYSPLL